MNDNSPSKPSTSASHHSLTAEAISRRAYEIWEKEGRPEARDLHHWLRAEKELLAEQGQDSSAANPSASRQQNTDTQPLQGTRGAPAAARDTKPMGKRNSTPPFSGDRVGTSRPSTPGMRTGGRS